jgi:general secretion pathway protein C
MPFDRLLEKNFGALVLLGAATGAFLSALGVVRIAQAAVMPNAALLAAAPVLARPTVNASDRNVSADPILAKGIHRVSANEYKIDRNVIDRVLANQGELTKIRVVPEQEQGKTVGLRLYGIKGGSLLDAIGIKNGDRIDSINGLDISTPDTALAAYAQLRTADHLVVKINRKGSATQIDYDIH